MQKIATKVFVCASVVFGVVGILNVLTLPEGGDNNASPLHMIFMKLMFITVMIILPSFALSIAGKYLNGKS
ncbi:MAG: hypothetical protein Q7S83_00450 [bacterium]|nr:hypothetical protein [bacterium]